ILKRLRGNDGQLYENLRSFCLQDYRSFEIVFGVRHLHDPAVAVVERLRHEFPGLELKLVADSRTIGTNLKVSNLANLVRHAKYDTLIVADSDMRVGPGYVREVVGRLDARGVRGPPGCRPPRSLPLTRTAAAVIGHMAGPDPRRRVLRCRDSEFPGTHGALGR